MHATGGGQDHNLFNFNPRDKKKDGAFKNTLLCGELELERNDGIKWLCCSQTPLYFFLISCTDATASLLRLWPEKKRVCVLIYLQFSPVLLVCTAQNTVELFHAEETELREEL